MDHFWNIPFFDSVEGAETGGWPIFWSGQVAGAQWEMEVCCTLYCGSRSRPGSFWKAQETELSLYCVHFPRPLGNNKFLEEWPKSPKSNYFPPLGLLVFHALQPCWVWIAWKRAALTKQISPILGVHEHIRISTHGCSSIVLNPQGTVMYSLQRSTAQPLHESRLQPHAAPLSLSSIHPSDGP